MSAATGTTRSDTRKRRDRRATEERLVQAVGKVLARDGFARLGVNAVAREAGVNNVLIYRYFGGLPGLVRAFAQSAEFWPQLEEARGMEPEAFRGLPPAKRVARGAVNSLRVLDNRPLTREILAWELVESGPGVEEVRGFREGLALRLREFLADLRGPETFDAQAVSAFISAAWSYLAVRSRTVDEFCGLNLRSEEGLRRLENVLEAFIESML